MFNRQSVEESRQPCRSLSRARTGPELESLSPPRAPSPPPLSGMYPEESRGSGGVNTVDFLDGTYDYTAPTPAPTLYSHSSAGYFSAPLDAHAPPSDGSLQSLGSGPSSPLVYVPSSPRLSPFMHPPSHHYVETSSTPVYRPGVPPGQHLPREEHSRAEEAFGVGDSGNGAGVVPGGFEMAKETRFCAVCSDYASGYHYGVWSCEGCKAFFKRSIQGHNDYMCPATNQCTIDRNRRKSCQACRLRKCYEVGMMKGGIRKDRGRVLRRDKKRTDRDKTSKDSHHKTQDRKKHSGCSSNGEPKFRVPGMSPEQVLQLLQGAEPPILCSRQKLSRPYSEMTMMTLLTSMADKELIHMINWAKKLPGFLDLSLHDQVLLLENSWLEVLMIALIWRSIHCPDKLIFAQDLILDRNEGDCVEGMAEIFDMLLSTAARFRMLKVRPEEFVCLKAIILLNSGAFSFCTGTLEPLHDSTAVQNILDTITDALIHYISQSGYSVHEQSRRQARLLLLLSHIRHMSNKGMEHLYSMKCKNKVPLYDLLLEMLDAHRLHHPATTSQSCSLDSTEPMYTISHNSDLSPAPRGAVEGNSKVPSPTVLQYGGPRTDCSPIV